jgi:hypothetical protein
MSPGANPNQTTSLVTKFTSLTFAEGGLLRYPSPALSSGSYDGLAVPQRSQQGMHAKRGSPHFSHSANTSHPPDGLCPSGVRIQGQILTAP